MSQLSSMLSLSKGLHSTCRVSKQNYLLSYKSLRSLFSSTPSLCTSVEKDATISAEQTEAEKELTEKVAQLSEKIEKLSEEVVTLKDKYQRTLADRENVRMRLEKQITNSKLYGIQSFCKDLLEVSDVFNKAISSMSAEQVKAESEQIKNLYDGVVMTEQQLLSVFRRHGLEQFTPSKGEKFNPSLQEAMYEVAVEAQEPGTIASVERSGWRLHERCIRSAQVGVVKQPN